MPETAPDLCKRLPTSVSVGGRFSLACGPSAAHPARVAVPWAIAPPAIRPTVQQSAHYSDGWIVEVDLG